MLRSAVLTASRPSQPGTQRHVFLSEMSFRSARSDSVGYINAATMALISPGVFFSIHLSDTRYSDLDLNSIKHSFVSAQDPLNCLTLSLLPWHSPRIRVPTRSIPRDYLVEIEILTLLPEIKIILLNRESATTREILKNRVKNTKF